MRLSILIPTWNNLDHLQACIASLRRNSLHDHQLVVHVNDGRDGTLDWVRAQHVEHTHSVDNEGICVPMNRIAQLARHDCVAYLNDDMIVAPGWDAPLLREAQRLHGRAWMLSATMIEPVDTGNPCVIVADYGRRPATFETARFEAEAASLPFGDWCGASWPPCVVPRELWHVVGGYSIEFSPGMSSDDDFSRKLWAVGCRTFKGVAASRAYHFQARSTGRIVRNDGAGQFLRKWSIAQSDFNRHVLRRGAPYVEPLPEPSAGRMRRAQWKARLKTLLR